MAVKKLLRPFLQAWNAAKEKDDLDHHAVLVSSAEEIDASSAEAEHQKQRDSRASNTYPAMLLAQNQEWEKMCIMAKSKTLEVALCVPMYG